MRSTRDRPRARRQAPDFVVKPGLTQGVHHLALVEELARGEHVSQRSIAEKLGMATGIVNRRIRELVDLGFVVVRDAQVRPYAYDLTESGHLYLRGLRHAHYSDVLDGYRRVQERIKGRLRRLRDEGVTRLGLYGAGDVGELCYSLSRALGFEVVGVVDDDPEKQGNERFDIEVLPPVALQDLMPDAVLITTFKYADEIRERLRPARDAGVAVREL